MKKLIALFLTLIMALSLFTVSASAVKLTVTDGVYYTTGANDTPKKYTGFATNKNGKMYIKSGKKLDEGWYYLTEEDKLTGKKPAKIKSTYYIDQNGYFLTGTQVIENYVYEFNKNGKLISSLENAKPFAVSNYNCLISSPLMVMVGGDLYYGIEKCSEEEAKDLLISEEVAKVSAELSYSSNNSNCISNYLPVGTKLYCNQSKDEFVAIYTNSLLGSTGAIRLVSDKNYFINLTGSTTTPNQKTTILGEEKYTAKSYIILDELIINYISQAKYLGKIKRQTDKPKNDFESNIYPKGTKLYQQGSYIIAVYPDEITGVEKAELLSSYTQYTEY